MAEVRYLTIIPEIRTDESGCVYDYVVREASDDADIDGHTTIALFIDQDDAAAFVRSVVREVKSA